MTNWHGHGQQPYGPGPWWCLRGPILSLPHPMAGLDRLSDAEFARFHALNAAYRERFGFPFIICVRLTDKAGILAAMEQRLGNDRDAEIAQALSEIGAIVRLRLADMEQGANP